MSVIGRALAVARQKINYRILQLAFVKRFENYRPAGSTIDDAIMTEVIRARVLFDLNVVGGTEAFIPLDGLEADRPSDYVSVYRIPKERTDGRSINSVLNVTFADPTRMSAYGVAAGCQNTPMMQAAQGVMDAMGSFPVTQTAYAQLIAENVVMVRDSIVLPANAYLRCILANDENLSHIQLRSYPVLVELFVLAIKAYIYNTVIVDLDQAELVGGQQLGVIKTIIEGYADADELYEEHLKTKIRKVMYMNDQETWKRHMKMVVSGHR